MDYDLVGGIPTPLKNMKVKWHDDIPNIWKNKCAKPPTSLRTLGLNFLIWGTCLIPQSKRDQLLACW